MPGRPRQAVQELQSPIAVREAGDGRQAGSQAMQSSPSGVGVDGGDGLRLSTRRTTVRQASLQEEPCWAPMRARRGDLTVPLRCKQWGCPSCGPWLKARLRRSIVATCHANPQLRRFYTLTLPSEWHRKMKRNGELVPNPKWNGSTKRQAYQALNEMWVKFAKRVERRFGHRLSYGSVREPHKDGTPHIHGLLDNFFPFEKMRQYWNESGGGYCDVRLVETQRVSAYLAKYLSKEGNPPPKGCRKYATGGGIKFENVRPPRPPVRGDLQSDWIVEKQEVDGSWYAVRRRGHYRGLRDAMAAVAELRRLSDLAAALTVCVVCGGDHDIHATALYVDVVGVDQAVATVEWSCGHGPKPKDPAAS